MAPPQADTPVRLVACLFAALTLPAAASDEPVQVAPGTVLRWTAPATERCAEGERSWPPIGETCYYPIDLERTGAVVVERTRAGRPESFRAVVGDYPYRVQHLRLKDTSRVDLSPENLARAEEERRRVDALWELETSRRFELPLTPPLSHLEAQGSFGSKRFFNGEPRSPHSGEDYRATAGTPVLATAPGTVMIAEEQFFGGKCVFIDHGAGLVSMYMHLSEIDVAVGDEVRAGQRIGRVGATGRVTGPHLHFGLRWRGARIDPAVLVGE